MSELTPRQRRIDNIMQAIDELCKTHAEHAVACLVSRNTHGIEPSERDIHKARVDLAETLEENL